jgi:hypothetical protein
MLNCKGCAERREAIKEWTEAMRYWSQDPVRRPFPGTKEWYDERAKRDSAPKP